MNRGGYGGGGHYSGMGGYNADYGMGPGPGPMHAFGGGGGGGMMGAAGVGAGAHAAGNITNSSDPKSKAARVFIGNLNTGYAKRQDVEEVFRKYGPILGISIHNGYGFIQFNNEHSAKRAVMEEQGKILYDQPVDLRVASDPDKNRPKGFRRVQGETFRMDQQPHHHHHVPNGQGIGTTVQEPANYGEQVNGIGRLGGMMGALQNIIDRNSPGNLTNSTHPEDLASRLFIGNLNTGLVTRQNVENIFSKYGKITGISLHKGFGFVQFSKPEEAMESKKGEHGRILAEQPFDLHIANEPDRDRPKGFKRVQGESKYTGYVDPTLLPIHPTSGPPAKRKKEEGDEPDDWQCSICDEITMTSWQLIKHAATVHELVIYRDNKAMQTS